MVILIILRMFQTTQLFIISQGQESRSLFVRALLLPPYLPRPLTPYLPRLVRGILTKTIALRAIGSCGQASRGCRM